MLILLFEVMAGCNNSCKSISSRLYVVFRRDENTRFVYVGVMDLQVLSVVP